MTPAPEPGILTWSAHDQTTNAKRVSSLNTWRTSAAANDSREGTIYHLGGFQLSLATQAAESTWAVKTVLGPDLDPLLINLANLGSNTWVTFSTA